MKKVYKLMLAALIAAAGIVAVSCDKDKNGKEDDGNKDKDALTIAEWVKEGIMVDMQSHAVEMNIKADGEWSAVCDPDKNWMAIADGDLTYNGPRKVLLCIDENRTEVDRTSSILVEDKDGEIYEIPVRQNYNYNGEAPTNGNGLAFSNNGVGFGVDYDYVLDTKSIAKRNALEDARIANKSMQESDRTTFAPTKVKKNNPIFNINRIERLMSAEGGSKLGPQAYVETEIPFVDLYAQLMDSTVSQAKHLDVSLELGVSFGCIEFAAAATYESDADEQRQKMDYTIVRNSPIYNVTISEAEIASYAEDAMYDFEANYKAGVAEINKYIQSCYEKNGKNELTKVQQKMVDGKYKKLETPTFDGVFAASFGQIYWDLFTAVAEENEDKINSVLEKVDSYYGPFFISGGDFGGAMTIHAVINNLSMEGFVTAKGNLDADFAGAFRVTGEFNYSEEGMTMMRDANARFYIYGGDANGVSDMMSAIMFGDNPTDRDAWNATISGWIDDMRSSGTAAPISFIVTPIWNLFWDEEMQLTAKNWFMDKYKDRGIEDYFGLMNGETKQDGNPMGAEDFLRKAQEALIAEGYLDPNTLEWTGKGE